MKIIRTASNYSINISQSEWIQIGQAQGWINEAADFSNVPSLRMRDLTDFFVRYLGWHTNTAKHGEGKKFWPDNPSISTDVNSQTIVFNKPTDIISKKTFARELRKLNWSVNDFREWFYSKDLKKENLPPEEAIIPPSKRGIDVIEDQKEYDRIFEEIEKKENERPPIEPPLKEQGDWQAWERLRTMTEIWQEEMAILERQLENA